MSVSGKLSLHFRETLVAKVTETGESEGTVIGRYRVVVPPDAGDDARRALEFMAFFVDWNARNGGGKDAADVKEFEAFDDVIGDGLWHLSDSAGGRQTIDRTPNFLSDEDLAWIVVNEEAS